MRLALRGLVCLLALLTAACSNKEDTVSRLEGSEPSRLSFGSPGDVHREFTAQMQSCWFEGQSAPLSGFVYDTEPARFETAQGVSSLHQVRIRSSDDDDAQTFIVQFFPFNNNTLISTRNLSLPLDLAERMKRDIETWIFGRNDCGDRAQFVDATGSNSPPQISASGVQQAPISGWGTSTNGGATQGGVY